MAQSRSIATMTSSNGNFFRVTGPLCGEFTGPVNSPHKDQWRGALMFSLICVWITGWVSKREAGDLRRHRGHHDVNVMAAPYDKPPYDETSYLLPSRPLFNKYCTIHHRHYYSWTLVQITYSFYTRTFYYWHILSANKAWIIDDITKFFCLMYLRMHTFISKAV